MGKLIILRKLILFIKNEVDYDFRKEVCRKRLTEAYNNAEIEYFDNNSKYIFFSDCHRGIVRHLMNLQKSEYLFICIRILL